MLGGLRRGLRHEIGFSEMSVVAWDGRTLAADKQATSSSKIAVVTKIRRLTSGEVVAWTGSADCGLLMAKWYEDGADPEKWPDFQKDKDAWTRLIVASSTGAKFYEQRLVAIPVEDKFMAWGAGQDFALGAMAMGADARRAVEVAIRYSDSCGCGVDSFEVTHLKVVA